MLLSLVNKTGSRLHTLPSCVNQRSLLNRLLTISLLFNQQTSAYYVSETSSGSERIEEKDTACWRSKKLNCSSFC